MNEDNENREVEDLEKEGSEELKRVLGDEGVEHEKSRAEAKSDLRSQRAAALEGESDTSPVQEEQNRELTPDEAERLAKEKAAKKAKIAQILDRGILNEKLRVLVEALPNDRVGLMVRNRPEDIDRIRALGGRVERRSNLKGDVSGVHGTGDDKLKVGDVILMSVDHETAEIIDEVQKDQVDKKLKRGKREYHERAQTQKDVPIIDHSEQRIGGRR